MEDKISVYEMTKYINHYTSDLSVSERHDILQMVVSSVPNNKIHTKGDGTQIKFSDIPHATIIMIYSYIKRKILNKKEQLQYISESEGEAE